MEAPLITIFVRHSADCKYGTDSGKRGVVVTLLVSADLNMFVHVK